MRFPVPGESAEVEKMNRQIIEVLTAVVEKTGSGSGAFITIPSYKVFQCQFCSAMHGGHFFAIPHYPDCAVLKARIILRDADVKTAWDEYKEEQEEDEAMRHKPPCLHEEGSAVQDDLWQCDRCEETFSMERSR